MSNPAVFIGEPLLFKNKFYVYPPKIKDVVGNPLYNQFVKLLTISQEDIEDELSKKENKPEEYPTPLEFLLINCYHSAQFKDITIKAF